MNRQRVESGHIASIGHDPASNTLEVEFKNGGRIYHYYNVSAQKAAELLAADSVGSHLDQHIKGVHTHKRIK